MSVFLAVCLSVSQSVHSTATWDQFWNITLKLPRLGTLGLPLTHRVKILQKSSLDHNTSCITHHTSNIAYKIVSFTKKNDQKSCALQQLIKTYPKEVCDILVYESYQIDDKNVYVKSKISQINHFRVYYGTL